MVRPTRELGPRPILSLGMGSTYAGSGVGIVINDAGDYYEATDLDGILQEIGGKLVGYLAHGNLVSTETFDAEIGWHSGTLNANCVFTLTANPTGTVSSLFLELAQDGTGGWAIDLPSSVVNKTELEADQITTADTTALLVLLSRDGGVNWFGGWWGQAGSADLSALTAIVTGYLAHGNTGATETFDAAIGWHSATLDSATVTFTLTALASGTVSSLFLELAQDGAGGRAISLPASVVNKTELEADQDTTASETTFLALVSRDGGTTWYGGWWGQAAPAGGGITVEDEGSPLSTAATTLDFVGAGVVASGGGATKTITISGGSGSVATDSIWDAAGDLAVGTGSDTAARLAIGAVGGHLSRINGAVAWDSGTSNPGSAVAGDRYWRSDLGLTIYYDGTRWLSTTLFHAGTQTNTIAAINTGLRFQGPAMNLGLDLWLVAADLHVGVFGTNTGANYWTYTVDKRAVTDTATTIFTANTSAITASNWVHVTTAIGASCAISTCFNFVTQASVKTGSPGNLSIGGGFTYRLIVT